jgi:hypothetical protein
VPPQPGRTVRARTSVSVQATQPDLILQFSSDFAAVNSQSNSQLELMRGSGRYRAEGENPDETWVKSSGGAFVTMMKTADTKRRYHLPLACAARSHVWSLFLESAVGALVHHALELAHQKARTSATSGGPGRRSSASSSLRDPCECRCHRRCFSCLSLRSSEPIAANRLKVSTVLAAVIPLVSRFESERHTAIRPIAGSELRARQMIDRYCRKDHVEAVFNLNYKVGKLGPRSTWIDRTITGTIAQVHNLAPRLGGLCTI